VPGENAGLGSIPPATFCGPRWPRQREPESQVADVRSSDRAPGRVPPEPQPHRYLGP
jgi:hypothetical protein